MSIIQSDTIYITAIWLGNVYMFAFAYRCPLCPRIAFQTKSEVTLRAGLRHRIVLLPKLSLKTLFIQVHVNINMDSWILFISMG